MRRFKQQLTDYESIEILRRATSGVLALCGNDMKPYGVPLSHVYNDGKLFFHSALAGHKIDILKQNKNASFTVIAQDEIHPESFTTYFRSVIAFWKIRVIKDGEEKMRALELLGHRFSPDEAEKLSNEIARGFSRCLILEMDIELLSGKQAIELVNNG